MRLSSTHTPICWWTFQLKLFCHQALSFHSNYVTSWGWKYPLDITFFFVKFFYWIFWQFVAYPVLNSKWCNFTMRFIINIMIIILFLFLRPTSQCQFFVPNYFIFFDKKILIRNWLRNLALYYQTNNFVFKVYLSTYHQEDIATVTGTIPLHIQIKTFWIKPGF